jgi:hypothetical protein
VKELLVDRIHGEVLRREPEATLERMGYLTRVVETELFEAARAPMPWLAELSAGRGPADVAEELAAAEPLGAPDPADPSAATWRVPGPGGHVRHLVAMLALGERGQEAKREWLRGFFRRCCEEG